MNENKPILGITIGDPASIGPEIALKALSDKGVYNISNPLLIGDSKLLQRVINKIGINVNINLIESDLFKNIPKQQFDFIVINPPYYQKDPETEILSIIPRSTLVVTCLATSTRPLTSTWHTSAR